MLEVYDNYTASLYLNQIIRWIDVKHMYQISFMMVKAITEPAQTTQRNENHH